MAAVFKVFAAVFLVVVALCGPWVSAQTHHVVGDDRGWGPDLDVSSWLSGRVFSVGDKIWFKYSGTEDSIVELEGLEEFLSCNLTNPIKMYTDPVTHVALEKEGVRYFTSGNLESCKKGLKLPVPVNPFPEFGPPLPVHSPPPFEPFTPDKRTPPIDPPVPVRPPPPPPFHPPVPVWPPPPPFHPPVPVRPPPPPHEPPTPRPPSAATHLNGLSFVLSAGLLICYIGI